MREDVYVIIYYDDSSEKAALVGLYYNEKVAEAMYKKELKKLRDFVHGSFSDDAYLQLASLPVKRIDADMLVDVVDEPATHDFYNYVNTYGIYLELVGIKLDRINDKDDED